MLQPQVFINPLISTLAQILCQMFLPNIIQYLIISPCLLLKCHSMSFSPFFSSFLFSLPLSITLFLSLCIPLCLHLPHLPPSITSLLLRSLLSPHHLFLPLTLTLLFSLFLPVSFQSPFILPIISP